MLTIIIAVVFYQLLSRTLDPKRQAVAAPLSVIGAYILSSLVGSAQLGDFIPMIDAGIFAALGFWLWLRPGYVPAALIAVGSLLEIIITSTMLSGAGVALIPLIMGILIHIVLLGLTLRYMWQRKNNPDMGVEQIFE